MTEKLSYLEVNRANWDDRAAIHVDSPDYRVSDFRANPDFISDVVRFDLPRLGDVSGLRGVHLQCHIGTDTLSLHRLGAAMTGLDFSEVSLQHARELATAVGADIGYVQADVYDAVDALGGPEQFDLVYVSMGALGWLPSVDRWAEVVARLLKPGGRLFIREGHPVLWSLSDPRPDGVIAIDYPYFETTEPTVWDDDVTYVTPAAGHVGSFQNTVTHEWNHGLGAIGALLRRGMIITDFEEHECVPYRALGDQMAAHPDHPGEYRLGDRPDRLAASYTLQAVKPA